MKAEQLIKENAGTIVDVRTTAEFQGGNVIGSINIPMQEITNRMDEIKALKGPIILCCASGGRSGQVHGFLAQNGVECVNAGSWMDVNYYKS